MECSHGVNPKILIPFGIFVLFSFTRAQAVVIAIEQCNTNKPYCNGVGIGGKGFKFYAGVSSMFFFLKICVC